MAASCCSSLGHAAAVLSETKRMQMKWNLRNVARHRPLVTIRLRKKDEWPSAALPMPERNQSQQQGLRFHVMAFPCPQRGLADSAGRSSPSCPPGVHPLILTFISLK